MVGQRHGAPSSFRSANRSISYEGRANARPFSFPVPDRSNFIERVYRKWACFWLAAGWRTSISAPKIDYNSSKSFIEACLIAQRNPTATALFYPRGPVRCAPNGLVGACMLLAVNLQSATLDLPTLSLVAICIAGLLGLFLIIDWMQQRNVRALAWGPRSTRPAP